MPRKSTTTKAQRMVQLSLEIGRGKAKLFNFVRRRDKQEQKLRLYITSRETKLHRLMG